MTTNTELTVGRTNNGYWYFEVIDGDRLVARVVNFDTEEQARNAGEVAERQYTVSTLMEPDTNDLLAAFEAATNYADYIAALVKVEQRVNTLDRNGYSLEEERVRNEWKRISAERGPIVTADYGKGFPMYSLKDGSVTVEPPVNLLAAAYATRRAEHVGIASSFIRTALAANRTAEGDVPRQAAE